MITRRESIVAMGVAALFPRTVFGQQATKIIRVGYLGPTTAAASYTSRWQGFQDEMRALGYQSGRNIAYQVLWANNDATRLPELAAELVRSNVDLILTNGTPAVLATKRATSTIPIVMAASGDAVGTGIVPSLARPGGNITGITFFDPELSGKRLALLKDLNPKIRRIAIMFVPGNPVNTPILRVLETTASHLKLKFEKVEIKRPEEIPDAIASIAKSHVDAFSLTQDTMIAENLPLIATHALKHRLPAIGQAEFVQAGGLIGYGVDIHALFRRSAHIADKILKGAKPADIPIEQPTTFQLVVNLKTARALGLKIPQSIIVQATKVIE